MESTDKIKPLQRRKGVRVTPRGQLDHNDMRSGPGGHFQNGSNLNSDMNFTNGRESDKSSTSAREKIRNFESRSGNSDKVSHGNRLESESRDFVSGFSRRQFVDSNNEVKTISPEMENLKSVSPVMDTSNNDAVSPSLTRRRRRKDRNSDALQEFYKHAENIRNGIARSEDNLSIQNTILPQHNVTIKHESKQPPASEIKTEGSHDDQPKIDTSTKLGQTKQNVDEDVKETQKQRVRKRDSFNSPSDMKQRLTRKTSHENLSGGRQTPTDAFWDRLSRRTSQENLSGRQTPTQREFQNIDHSSSNQKQMLSRKASHESLMGRQTPTQRDFNHQFSNESQKQSYRGSCDSLMGNGTPRTTFRGSSDSINSEKGGRLKRSSSGRITPDPYVPTFHKRESYDKPWIVTVSPPKQAVSRKTSLEDKRKSMESPIPSQPYTPDLHKRESYDKPWLPQKPVARKQSVEKRDINSPNSEVKVRRHSKGRKRKESVERHPDQLRIGCAACLRRAEMKAARLCDAHSTGFSLEHYQFDQPETELDLDNLLDNLKQSDQDGDDTIRRRNLAKSEDEFKNEKDWLNAEKVWLVHKGGFAGAFLLKADPASPLPEGKVRIRLESSGDILEVEEDDIEKANPPQFDRAEDLASLRYLNESSSLHTLRQRFAGSLIHTYAGPSLIVINPMKGLPLYSEKLIQMLKGCKQEDMPPHVFSMAQIAHREMLATRRDQSIIMMGRSGSGKTANCNHILSYLTISANSINNILNGDKINAISVLTEAFGNCRTLLNTSASRFTRLFTIDFDHSGQIASASLQVLMLEKTRVVRRPEGEPTFNIFYEMLAGLDSQLRNELQLQVLTEPNLFMTPLQKNEDRQKATTNWAKVLNALTVVGGKEDEIKALFSVLAAIYHLGVAGASKGNNNKAQFTRPAAAQKAASLLGTTAEDLARSIFNPPSNSTLSRSTSMRLSNGVDRGSPMVNGEVVSPAIETLEGFVIGLYSDVFNAVVSIINRSLSSNIRAANSIILLDSPGFQNPASCGRSGASFEDLCQNYTQERLQLFFHDLTFTLQQDRYAQENIDCDFDFVTTSPAAMVSLFDKSPQQSLLRSSNQDLRDAEKKGLLWILDEEAIFPGATEDSFMERFFSHHGEHPVRRESLLRKGSQGPMFILNHYQGTCPIQYDTTGWLKSCRENPVSRNSLVLLQDSKKYNISQLFTTIKGSGGVVSGSVAGMDGSASLRRVGSMRRTFMSGTAGLKKKSICLQIKFQVDSIIETIRKTKCHFLHCMIAQNNAGLCELRQNGDKDEQIMNVPLVRSQLRGFELLDAVRVFRQGFPDHMQFSEFRQKFEVLLQPDKRPGKTTDEQKSVMMLMDHLDIDKLNYRIGLSQFCGSCFKMNCLSCKEEH
ncbi:hypothetical protein LOTGIDRAFT_163407 [Lottia gigantea]|uniref:Myosin motor domain-containing protein n=1 Tax=Lottia gigantea TaxID=225164 RepID=V4A4N3_LOTGI|nr:hypothetical protein LOTGIDRAFT_163407 [Lottia gigantea]ESO91677.1 hypothetical protein LOTGIDRAFT_163407 [Lottia gigantea]